MIQDPAHEIATLAHDAANALQVVTLRIQMTKGALPDNSGSIVDQLDRGLAAAMRSATLVRQILAIATRSLVQLNRDVELNRAIEEVGEDCTDLMPGIDVKLELSTSKLWSRVDAEMLNRALLNLANNARDAMPTGGALTLAAQLQDEDRMVCIQVRDTGTGMDDVTRARCLERGFTTKGARGNGLGLAMVNDFVREHRGRLRIETAPGKGTMVEMCFPRVLAGERGEVAG